jgi:hypothetical protein
MAAGDSGEILDVPRTRRRLPVLTEALTRSKEA